MITCRTRGQDSFNPVWHRESCTNACRSWFVKILCFEVIGVDFFSLPWSFMQEFNGKKSRLCSDIFVRNVGGGC